METTMYLAIARQAVLRREMESVAHNLANSSTTGYKSQAPLFKEVLESQRAYAKVVVPYWTKINGLYYGLGAEAVGHKQ